MLSVRSFFYLWDAGSVLILMPNVYLFSDVYVLTAVLPMIVWEVVPTLLLTNNLASFPATIDAIVERNGVTAFAGSGMPAACAMAATACISFSFPVNEYIVNLSTLPSESICVPASVEKAYAIPPFPIPNGRL